MPLVRLGKMALRWCTNCNIPILELTKCGLCKNETVQVKYTPPGDVRPAFQHDIELIRKVTDDHFGLGTGDALLKTDSIILLNKVPALDRADEIIVDGKVVAIIEYDLIKKWRLVLKLEGAQKICSSIKKRYIIIADDVIKYLQHGCSLLVVGCELAHEDISKDDEVVVLNSKQDVIATGIAKKSGREIMNLKYEIRNTKYEIRDTKYEIRNTKYEIRNTKYEIRNTKYEIQGVGQYGEKKKLGSAVKIREVRLDETSKCRSEVSCGKGDTQHTQHTQHIQHIQYNLQKRISKTIEGNRSHMNRRVWSAIKLIRNAVEKNKELPVIVSFSGGKDSLVTLDLVVKSGLTPEILFIDTGLEFPETHEMVKKIRDIYGLKIVIGKNEKSLWDDIPYFGPPGKDYRWCCKTLKLGPATRVIKEKYPNGILSFIGQRAYESEVRSQTGNTWINPWVAKQVAVSPIQHWTALHVWLYIFMNNLPYNSWYERGLDRIGCFMCPASTQAELNTIESEYPDYQKWKDTIQNYAPNTNHSSLWTEYGLWRWKNLPPGIRRYLTEKNINFETERRKNKKSEDLKLYITEGTVPCEGIVSIEGSFNRPIEKEKIRSWLNILGVVKIDEEMRLFRVNNIEIFESGMLIIKDATLEKCKESAKLVETAIRMGSLCVGCGICSGRCNFDALKLVNNRAVIDITKCRRCKLCLKGPCPVVVY